MLSQEAIDKLLEGYASDGWSGDACCVAADVDANYGNATTQRGTKH